MSQEYSTTNKLLKTPTRGSLLKSVEMIAAPNKPRNIFDSRSDEQSVFNMVNSIMTLAMLNCDVLHIQASYSAHVKAFQVRVNPASTNYEFPSVQFKEHIYLDKPKAFEKLQELEDALIELVADAKDLAMEAV